MVHGHGHGRHTFSSGGGGGGLTSPGPIGGSETGAGGGGVTGLSMTRSFRAPYCSVPPARSPSSVCIQEQIHMNFRVYDYDF